MVGHVNTISHGQLWNAPFKLKCLVKVLPHPGTGQAKFASVFLRLSLASAVAVVVALGLPTVDTVFIELIPWMTCHSKAPRPIDY